MKRWLKVQAIALSVLALIVAGLVAFDVPAPGWGWQLFAGLVLGLAVRMVAELLLDWQHVRRFKAVWRKAKAERKPPTVIE